MPYVSIQITTGSKREQREQVVREFTETLQRVLGKQPEHIHVVIQEIPEDAWGFGGMLTDDFRRAAPGPSKAKRNR